MSNVSIRDLRNHGGEVVDRVLAGERLTVTKAGKAVAELSPIPKAEIDAGSLLRRWKNLPLVDSDHFRDDVDSLMDSTL